MGSLDYAVGCGGDVSESLGGGADSGLGRGGAGCVVSTPNSCGAGDGVEPCRTTLLQTGAPTSMSVY